MWPLVLAVLVVFLLGGWGYGAWRGAGYVNPTGIIGFLLLIALVVVLVRGAL